MRQDSELGEHVASYYHATAREPFAYPALKGHHAADVAVVGGGFTGLSAALALAERGVDVALVEARRIGWGASGRNGGQLIDGFADPHKIGKRLGPDAERLTRKMGLECRDLVLERIRRYDIACDLQLGFLEVATNGREVAALESELDDRRAHGIDADLEFVPRDALRHLIGSERYRAGLVNRRNGHLHPLDLCLGEARAAARLGVRIYEQSPVIEVRRGRDLSLHTPLGSLTAKQVVLAGNAYLGGLEPALTGQVIPAGSYLIATEVLDRSLAENLLPERMAVCDMRVVLDYFRLSADDRLLFGGLCNYSGRHPKDIAARLRPKMLSVFPQLADARIDYQWGGDIGISINRIPQLGRIGNNVYYAQGYSGHGLAPSHLAGAVLADALQGDAERFDVFARIGHLKLPGGRWVANPLLALGMLYYRLKELL